MLVSRVFPDGREVQYHENGKVAAEISSDKKFFAHYNADGKKTEEKLKDGTYLAYHKNGKVSVRETPDNVVIYYDKEGKETRRKEAKDKTANNGPKTDSAPTNETNARTETIAQLKKVIEKNEKIIREATAELKEIERRIALAREKEISIKK